MPEEINVCCPYFRTLPCADTKEHRHIICKLSRDLITNSETIFKCISNYNWESCAIYQVKPIKD